MLEKQDVLHCYLYLLDRAPENDHVVEEKCQANSLEDLIEDMVTSAEFLETHKVALTRHLVSDRSMHDHARLEAY